MQSKLQLIKNRLALATQGQWLFINTPDSIPCNNRIESGGKFVCKGASDISPWDISPEDGEFIAHAYEDVSFLLKQVSVLLEKLEELTKNNTIVINLQELPDV
jgi:hypothetical protein